MPAEQGPVASIWSIHYIYTNYIQVSITAYNTLATPHDLAILTRRDFWYRTRVSDIIIISSSVESLTDHVPQAEVFFNFTLSEPIPQHPASPAGLAESYNTTRHRTRNRMSQLNSTEAVTSVTAPPNIHHQQAGPMMIALGEQNPSRASPLSQNHEASAIQLQGTSQGNARTYQANPQSGSASLTQAHIGYKAPSYCCPPPSSPGFVPPSSSTPITAATAGHSTPTGSLRVDVTSLSTKGPPAPPPKSPRHNPNFLRSLSADTVPPLPTTMGSGQSKATPPAAPLSEPTRQRHPHSLQAEKQPQGNLASHQVLLAMLHYPHSQSTITPVAFAITASSTIFRSTIAVTNACDLDLSGLSGAFVEWAAKYPNIEWFIRQWGEQVDAQVCWQEEEVGGCDNLVCQDWPRVRRRRACPRGPASPPTSSQSAGSQQPKYSPMPLVSSPPPISPPTARKPSPIPIPPAMISAVVEPVAGSVQELTVPANRDRASVIAVSPGMTSALNFMRTLPEAKGTETHAEGFLVQSIPASHRHQLQLAAAHSQLHRKFGGRAIPPLGTTPSAREQAAPETLDQYQWQSHSNQPLPWFLACLLEETSVEHFNADMEIGVMVEEDGEDTEEAFHLVKQSPPASSSARTSPVLSAKQQKRRSVSLNLGALSSAARSSGPFLGPCKWQTALWTG
ncbi:hypothetical protein BKA70DRAFT_1406843, partial [Coprinopsis sp. MPI-PUGE-AT-0042]